MCVLAGYKYGTSKQDYYNYSLYTRNFHLFPKKSMRTLNNELNILENCKSNKNMNINENLYNKKHS